MNFKLWWKQLFCRHIYKTIKSNYLRTEKEITSDDQYGYFTKYDTYSYYAQNQICLRCGKERIIEKRLLDI